MVFKLGRVHGPSVVHVNTQHARLPLPEFLIQQVWVEVQDSAFLTSSQVMLMLWDGYLTLRTTQISSGNLFKVAASATCSERVVGSVFVHQDSFCP